MGTLLGAQMGVCPLQLTSLDRSGYCQLRLQLAAQQARQQNHAVGLALKGYRRQTDSVGVLCRVVLTILTRRLSSGVRPSCNRTISSADSTAARCFAVAWITHVLSNASGAHMSEKANKQVQSQCTPSRHQACRPG